MTRRMFRMLFVPVAAATLLMLLSPCNAEHDAEECTILDTFSFWRCHFTYMHDVVQQASGDLKTIREVQSGWGKEKFTIKMPVSSPPPADWMSADFNDGAWIRRPGPFGSIAWHEWGYKKMNADPPLRLIGLRGTFEVHSPDRAAGMSLSATYHGGVVVYLNGKEIARQHLPAGAVAPGTLAEIYPDEAYIDEKGKPRQRGAEQHDRFIRDLTIPATLLRKGTNVLAIELHRPPAPEIWAKTTTPRNGYNYWAMVGLDDLKLTSTAGLSAVVPNVSRPRKLCVRTVGTLIELHDRDYPDPEPTTGP